MQSGFWLLILADGISALGSQAGSLACTWSVLANHRSTFWVAAIAIGFGVSNAIASPFVGILLDKLPKKQLIVGANVLLAIIWMGLSLLVQMGDPVWMWFLLLVFAGLLTPCTDLGWMVLVPLLVAEERLNRANSIGELVFQGALLAGPVVGAGLADSIGTPAALLLDAVSFCVAGLVMYRLPMPKTAKSQTASEGQSPLLISVSQWFVDMLAGARFLLRQRIVLLVTALAFVLNFEAGLTDVAFPLMVHGEFHGGALWLATLMGVYALGMGVGALAYGFLKVNWMRCHIPLWTVFIWALCLTPFLFVHHFFALCVLTGLAGCVFGLYPPLARSTVQRLVPVDMRGRVFGFRMTALAISVPLGSFAAGSLSLAFHLTPTRLIGWTAVLIAGGLFIFMMISIWRRKLEWLQ